MENCKKKLSNKELEELKNFVVMYSKTDSGNGALARHTAPLLSTIDTLKQEVEELALQLDEEKSYSASYLKVGKERYETIQKLQARLSKIKEAVKPIRKMLVEYKSQPNGFEGIVRLGDLRNLVGLGEEG